MEKREIILQEIIDIVMSSFNDKDIELGAKDKILTGVNYLVDMVKVTLGAKGKTVLYNDRNSNAPRITKDGVTVANNIYSEDPYENMAIEIVREASQQTVKTSGDGTTTTAILAQYFINIGYYLMNKYNISFYDLSKRLDKMRNNTIEFIKANSLSVEENFDKLLNIAKVSSNSDEIGNLLFDIIKEIGIYGFIEVKKSNNSQDVIDRVKGIKLHKGFYAPQFVTDTVKMNYTAKGVFIVMVNNALRTWEDVNKYISFILDQYGLEKVPPVLFLVNDIEPALLKSLIANKLMNPETKIMFVENDGFGDRRIDILNMLSALTGKDQLYFPGDIYPIGFADEVIVTSETTSILGGNANLELIDEYVKDTKLRLEQIDLDENDRKYYKKKLSSLTGGVALIEVGALTEVEMIERKDRIDDAVEALRSSVDRGICVGGGYTFTKCYQLFVESADEIDVYLYTSLVEPLRQLCLNASNDFNEIVNAIKEDKGFNQIDEQYYDIKNYEIYDPAGVLIDSLSNAISVAKSILSIERSVYNS